MAARGRTGRGTSTGSGTGTGDPAPAATEPPEAEAVRVGPGAVEPAPELQPQPVRDPSVAAFFDVDNTIMRGASIYHFARGLYQRDFFTIKDVLAFAWAQISFALVGENLEHVAQVQERALTFVEGHPVEQMRTLGEEIYDELMADKIWPGTYSLALAHIAAGQRVWLVTATPVEMADVIARRLGLTGALGTVAEHENGLYTGRLSGRPMHGAVKAETVLALAEREGLDLARCSAYSDSSNDIPMLSLVGHPFAINPDSALRAHARSHGWQIRDYRTGRKVAMIGVPAAAAIGAVGGAVAGVLAVQRRRSRRLTFARI